MVVTPPLGLNLSEMSTGPIRASSSSWQTLMKWSPAEILCFRPCLSVTVVWTVAPTAFSRTRATKDFTTSKATSASRSETRMSRSDSSTSSGVISCFPASRFLAARKPLVTVSSMGGIVFNTGSAHVGPPSSFLACSLPQQVTWGLHVSRRACMRKALFLAGVLLLALPARAAEDGGPDDSGRFRVGVNLGIVSIPRPINVEGYVRLHPYLGVSGGWSTFPKFASDAILSWAGAKSDSTDASLNHFDSWEVAARVYPMRGTFFIGVGAGQQVIDATVSEKAAGTPIGIGGTA